VPATIGLPVVGLELAHLDQSLAWPHSPRGYKKERGSDHSIMGHDKAANRSDSGISRCTNLNLDKIFEECVKVSTNLGTPGSAALNPGL
jgi:hypothetical protein